MKVLSTPVGAFSLRADQEAVAFDVFDVTADANADYKFPVERALVLRPVLPPHFQFTELALVANLPANGFTWSDWCSDEFYAASCGKMSISCWEPPTLSIMGSWTSMLASVCWVYRRTRTWMSAIGANCCSKLVTSP